MNLSGFAQPAPGLAAHWEGEYRCQNESCRITLISRKKLKGEWIGAKITIVGKA